MGSTSSDDDAIREGEPPYYSSDRSLGEHRALRNVPAWRAALYEVAACIVALIGAAMFGFGIFPFINTIQWRWNYGPAYMPASVFSLFASFIVMWIGWRLSRKGQRLKQGANERH